MFVTIPFRHGYLILQRPKNLQLVVEVVEDNHLVVVFQKRLYCPETRRITIDNLTYNLKEFGYVSNGLILIDVPSIFDNVLQ